ncbi:GNAT family N-acetyltransferase [Ilyomonas limi]|uniref:GNAT family N-acetyltransferase n=1 Tax=Ilyomonas limi TaxID=2575867 RepID=A0A4U3L9J9_9BACT|nr:GNAT family N-acetyltransferase [Ilyomonas limi]TKK72001.1 GNAT family N-acetyltransferase [Ilyomonas limi]
MSLYTISETNQLPSIKTPEGLRVEVCTDVMLLSLMASTTVDEIIKRLANDHLAFVAYINNQPAAFGWMASGKAKIGELNHELILPERNRYLWNFRTLEAYRGLGIYPALLQFIIRYERHKANRFWIIHAPENKSSLRGIIKAGFSYVGTLYTKANGSIYIEATGFAETHCTLLASMGIQPSYETPASCWNCSSPFIKKRMPECCCSNAGEVCTDNTILSIAS